MTVIPVRAVLGEAPLILVRHNGTSKRRQRGIATGTLYEFKAESVLYVDERDWPALAEALTQDGDAAFEVVHGD